jgi:beta-lactam-binding protein with PASTA domain
VHCLFCDESIVRGMSLHMQEWPELVGTNAEQAKAKLEAETGLHVYLVPQGSVVTTDYRADRIRIYYDPATGLVTQPRPCVG